MSEQWSMVLVCTDRGAPEHEPVVVWEVVFHGPVGDVTADAVTIAPGTMLELDCSRCGRSPRFRDADMRKLARHVIEQFRAGEHRVVFDVSYLSR